MEIKSNNVLIGLFALGGLGALFLFALWIGRVQLDQTYKYYEVIFPGSVAGLTESGVVQYNGIPVGRVVELRLAVDDPSKVVAFVEVDARTPVKEDTNAQLELFGLTGVGFIELSGGSQASPPLMPKGSETYGTIYAAQSNFQELFMSAPDAIQNANALIVDLRVLVRENRQSVAQVMRNMETLSAQLAGSSNDIAETLANINSISASLEGVATSADELLQDDVAVLIREARMAATSYRKVADELEDILGDNRPAIDRFAQDGLGQLPRLIEESRDMVAALERFVSRAEGDPALFLLGRDAPEYNPD